MISDARNRFIKREAAARITETVVCVGREIEFITQQSDEYAQRLGPEDGILFTRSEDDRLDRQA